MKSFAKYTFCAIIMTFFMLSLSAQNHAFSSYRVPVYSGEKAKLVIKANPLAEEYRTIIRDTYYSKEYVKSWHGSTGLNFAGHYCFVYFGCGTSCSQSAVVDLKTGIVYPGVDGNLNYTFRRYSRLLIVNADNSEPDLFPKVYWVWSEGEKKFKKVN